MRAKEPFRGTRSLKTNQLRAIYRYLQNDLTQVDLAYYLGRTRTNTYYYIGRAVHQWILNGTLKWDDGINGPKDINTRRVAKRKEK